MTARDHASEKFDNLLMKCSDLTPESVERDLNIIFGRDSIEEWYRARYQRTRQRRYGPVTDARIGEE
jgi:hypothetical protein